MSTTGGSPEGLGDFNFGLFAPEIDGVLFSILVRSNEQAVAAESTLDFNKWNEDDYVPPH